VVLETVLSGISSLPFKTFVVLMQPIHLAIGIVEGLVTAALVAFVWKARPELLSASRAQGEGSLKKVLVLLAVATVVTGGGLSWFASTNPDGLEWAIARVSGTGNPVAPEAGIHASLGELQEKTAILPDYGFKNDEAPPSQGAEGGTWPGVDSGTTVSGLVGGALTLALTFAIGILLRRHVRKNHPS